MKRRFIDQRKILLKLKAKLEQIIISEGNIKKDFLKSYFRIYTIVIIQNNIIYNKIQSQLMMISYIVKKNYIKKALKWIFSGFSIFFISMLIFIVVYDASKGATSETTAEYCAKYGFFATPDCWSK